MPGGGPLADIEPPVFERRRHPPRNIPPRHLDHAVVAPESGRPCYFDGKRWRCGKAAANVLADLIDRRRVTCQERNRDRDGRVVAVCRVAGEGLGAWLSRSVHRG